MKKINKIATTLLLVLSLLLTTVLSSFSIVQAKTTIRLNKTKVSCEVDDQITLKVKGTKKKVKWKSNNRDVAVVSKKGKVFALDEGKATITATVGTLKLKCRITVESEEDTDDNDETDTTIPAPSSAPVTTLMSVAPSSTNSNDTVTTPTPATPIVTPTPTSTVSPTAIEYGSISGVITYQRRYNDVENTQKTVADNAYIVLVPKDIDLSGKNYPKLAEQAVAMTGGDGDRLLYFAMPDGRGLYNIKNVPVGNYLVFIRSAFATHELTPEYIATRDLFLKTTFGFMNETDYTMFIKGVVTMKYYSQDVTVKKDSNVEVNYDFGTSFDEEK